MSNYIFLRGRRPRIPTVEVSQGACISVFASAIGASARPRKPKTQVKKLLELGCGLVGSRRRTARAWGFSHDETHAQNAGLPRQDWRRRGRRGARREKNISYTYTHHAGALRSTCERGKLSGVSNECRAKGTEKRVSGESSKVLSAPDPEALWKD